MPVKDRLKESHLPKYRQLILGFEEAIRSGDLRQGDRLPSLNSVKMRYGVSRDTALLAFADLKQRGIVESVAGKGYYVKNENVNTSFKVFLLFDELNAFKEDLYKGFLSGLDPNAKVDIFFHHFNPEVFNSLIDEKAGNYNYYVIMPANLRDTSSIDQLPHEQVYILDQIPEKLATYPGVFQNFESNIKEGLGQLKAQLQAYEELILIYDEKKQPQGLKTGVEVFCKTYGLALQIQTEFVNNIQEAQLYLVLDDRDLIELLKAIKTRGLVLGEQIGILAYNDTMLKEIVEGGITSISTDFKSMGERLAGMLNKGKREQIDNSYKVINRASL